MTTQELLACATSKSTQYIQQVVNSKSNADYQKLKKFFDSQLFEANSFDDTELDILTFDWESLERDRNWWWQLQALPFLNWFANSFEIQSCEERLHYYSKCLVSIQCWMSSAKQNKQSPLVWHDHATAFRVRNIANWMLFCHIVGIQIGNDAHADALADLVTEHLDWLLEDTHYSTHTNHGFDQAMIALTIGLMFDCEKFGPHRQINRQRLKNEVIFAFTNEGVHKENSPGYQKMMLGRLKLLRTLALLGEQEISELGERYIENAEGFLKAVTLPNGYLPMIGDTRSEDEGLVYIQKREVDVLDYSASGYVIVRGIDGRDKDFFCLLKNTHESNYHRHDDDMMIYLFYDGETVLGDGGLYRHQETDDKRKHLRSYLSHNVPYIKKKAVRKNQDLIEAPVIKIVDKFVYRMTSMMFGEKLARNIEIALSPSLTISIYDHVIDDIGEKIWTNFFFENPYNILLDESAVRIHLSGFCFNVSHSKSAPIIVEKGWENSEEVGGAFVSKKYGHVERALRLSIAESPLTLSFS